LNQQLPDLPSRPLDLEAYAGFVRCIEFVGIFLTDTTTKRNWSASHLPTSPRVTVSYSVDEPMLTEDVLKTQMSFRVEAKCRDKRTSRKVFSLKFTLQLSYRLAEFDASAVAPDALSEILRFFARKNVPLNAWPYAREYVSSSTVRLGFPALVISTYKVNV